MEYLLCFSVSSLMLDISSKRIKRIRGKVLFVLAALIPILMATLRSTDVGIDVLVYVQPYASWAINSGSFASYITLAISNGVEIGYAVLNYIGANFFGGLPGVFFLSATLVVVPIYVRIMGYKEEIPVWISSLVYLLVFYNLSLNLTRQAIALSILFFSFKYVENKKYKLFFVFLIIGFLFHSSAILGIIYPILAELSKGKDWRIKHIAIVTTLIIFVAFYNRIFALVIRFVFSTSTDKYIKAFLPDETGYLSFWMLVINAFVISCVLISKHYLMKTHCYKIYLLIATFNFVLYILTVYNGNCFRYALYFMIMIPKIVPLVRYRFNKKSRMIADLMVIAVFLLYWINFNILEDSHGTIPYSLM